MRRRLLLIPCAALLISACSRTTLPPEDPARAAIVALRESQALCLADSAGNGPLEARLRAAQSAARQMQPGVEPWIETGRQWVRKARISSDPGFYLNVDGCVEEALAIVADDPSALALRGLVLMNTHRFDAARALSERMLTQDPDNVLALGTLSDAQLELGDYAQSLAAAQRQMVALPGMAAYSRGAYLSWLHGDAERAKSLIRDALHGRSRSDPEPAAWAFVEAARMFWHEGDLIGADALLAESLAWVADYPAALVLRARVALAQGEPARSVDYLTRAHTQHATIESAWLLSDAQAALDANELSQYWFEQAVRLGAQSDHLTLGLMLAVRNQQPERALKLLQSERRMRGGVHIDDAYAWALYRAGRIHDAAHFSNQALRLGTPDARVLYHAGAIRIAQGQADAGTRLITRALALNPEFDRREAAAARALLGAFDALASR